VLTINHETSHQIKIEREKQIAIEAKEQERKRIIEAQKQEQDIIDRENMRKDKEALAQRKSTVENKVFYLLTLVNKTPVIFITSFAYRATLFALSVVPLKLIAKS
jgi:hypothetical protein